MLEGALQEAYPNSKINMYGSSVNGFGTHNCDLDLHFHVPLCDIPSGLPEKSLKVSGNSSLEIETIIAKDVAMIIQKCIVDCINVRTIINNRFALVKFQHKSSGIICDLSMHNEMAVINTEYLVFLSNIFPPLVPLVYFVRCWMKHHSLSVSGNRSGSSLSNYTVTLLVVFFLQNTKRIESLDNMRNLHELCHTDLVRSWNCSFPKTSKNSELFLGVNKVNDLKDLISDFFYFYSNMNFADNVLNLHTGQISVLKSEQSNGSFKCNTHNYFKGGALNVKDPFELTRNVAGNVGAKHMKSVVSCLRNATVATKMKVYKATGGDNWGILNLFVDHHLKKKLDDNSLSGKSPNCLRFSIDNCLIKQLSETAETVCATLLLVLCSIFRNKCIVQDHSFENTCDLNTLIKCLDVNQLLQSSETEPSGYTDSFSSNSSNGNSATVILCGKRKLDLVDSPISKKKRKLDIKKLAGLPMSKNIPLPIKLVCSVNHKLWIGRRKARRKIGDSNVIDIHDLERRVSSILLSQETQLIKKQSRPELNMSLSSSDLENSIEMVEDEQPFFKYLLTCSKDNESNLNCVFELINEDQLSEFANLFHHLETFVPTFVKKYHS